MFYQMVTFVVLLTFAVSPVMGNTMDTDTGALLTLSQMQLQQIRTDKEGPAYDFHQVGLDTYRAVNRPHGMTASFDKKGFSATIASGQGTYNFSLVPSTYGYAAAPLALTTVTSIQAVQNRVDMQWGKSLTEWHVNGSDGLRQNFTLSQRPENADGNSGQLMLTLNCNGDLTPAQPDAADTVAFLTPEGRTAFTYGKLKVYDAAGRILPARMHLVDAGDTSASIRVQVDDTLARYPVTIDPLLAQFETKRVADDVEPDDLYGSVVALSEDTAVVGAPEDYTGQGSAYIFYRNQGGTDNWGLVAKIVNEEDGQAGDNFGTSASISGNYMVIGAPGYDGERGKVYLYSRPETEPTNWTLLRAINLDEVIVGDFFGCSVSIDGDYLAVGAYGDHDQGDESGAVYIFGRNLCNLNQGENTDCWGLMAKLPSLTNRFPVTYTPQLESGDYFGQSVSILGDYLMVGAVGKDNPDDFSGLLYAFYRDEQTDIWEYITEAPISEGNANDFLGFDVSFYGATGVAGAPYHDGGTGAIYIRELDPLNEYELWITPEDLAGFNLFGMSVSMYGDIIAAGAPSDDAGSVYVYDRNQGGQMNWGLVRKIRAEEGVEIANFGWSVTASGDTLIVGAPGSDSIPGAAFIYQQSDIVTQPQANNVNVSVTPDITAVYPFALNPSTVSTDHFIINGSLSGQRPGMVSTDVDTAIWTPTAPFFAGETVMAQLLPGITSDAQLLPGLTSDSSVVQKTGISWKVQIMTQPSAAAFRTGGSFQTTGITAGGAALGDLDKDGDLDVVVANDGTNTVWVNSGMGEFTDSGQALGSANSHGAVPGDLDGDGDLDVIFTNDGANTVWMNNGGVFTDSGQALGAADSFGAAVVDVDGDGDLDVIFANDGPNTVWLNDAGVFTDSGQVLGGSVSYGVATSDLDGDGDPDVIFADDGANTVWLNNAGVFTDSGQALGSAVSYGLAIGDLDGDGDLDVIFANDGPNTVWLNDWNGTFADSGQALGNSTSRGILLGDMNGNGDLDALTANDGADEVWINNGDGSFSVSNQALNPDSAVASLLGDLDGDGDLDIVAVNADQTHGVWFNTSLPSVATDAVTNVEKSTATAAGTLIALGDHNIMAHGFVWNTTGSPTTSGSYMDLGPAGATGDFSADLIGLTPDTTYYIRAYAANTAGFAYGTESSFTTAKAATKPVPQDDTSGDDTNAVPAADSSTPAPSGGGGGGCFITVMEF